MITPIRSEEKPKQPGWYVVLDPHSGETEVVRVRTNMRGKSEPILSVTCSGSGDHHPLITTDFVFIARIDLEQVRALQAAGK